MMKISERGLDIIRKHEGLRLKAYKCPAGVWTIGYGSTRGVTDGMEITADEANMRLWRDVKDSEKCVNGAVTVPLTQGEFDALCSFVFNLGCGAFRRSTLLRLLNDSDYDRAADEFARWNKAGGRVLPGLVARREEEKKRFEDAA
jgi:lysozyme